jgi:hypothetical protein
VTLATKNMHVYEVRPRNDKRGVDLISNALPFGCLWYAEPSAISNAIDYAKFYSTERIIAMIFRRTPDNQPKD